MKTKTLILILFAMLPFLACSQPNNTFKITGQIDNIADGTVVQLHTVEGSGGRLFKTDTVRNGSFYFEEKVDSLQKLMLIAKGGKFSTHFRPIWVKPSSDTYITGNGYYLLGWKINSNIKEQQEEDRYVEILNQFPELDSLNSLSNELRNKISSLTSGQEKDEVMKKLETVDLQQRSVLLAHDSVLYDFMEKEPVSRVWIERLSQYSIQMIFDQNYKYANKLRGLYERLTPEQKQSQEGQLIHQYIFPKEIIKMGGKMPSAELHDPQGNSHQISEAYKGKYILLDFWNVGCAPCIMAFPEMKEIYDEKKDRLTIISITTDTEKIWKEGLKKHKLPWVNLTDNLGLGGYSRSYGVFAIPFYVLISPDGIVLNMWSGYGKGSLKEKLKDI